MPWFCAARTLAIAFLAVSGALHAQAPFAMKYLDEVGHLGNFDKRKSVDLGIAKAFADGEALRFEGHDAAGKLWEASLPATGGVGFTDVWTADFDRNGRQDLLIATYFPGNGRCIDGGVIYTLMLDDLGRPVPWMAGSNSFVGLRRPPVSIIKTPDGRAEMVTVSCVYSEPTTGFGEDRQISGIYEARDARWIPMRNAPRAPSLAAAKKQHGAQPGQWVRWLKTDPAQWPDFLAGYDSRPTVQIRSLITAEAGCGGIRIPIVNGRVVSLKEDPCEPLAHDRAVYSDGRTRQGWPAVVVDSSDGRRIFMSDDPSPALRKVLGMGYRSKLLGDPGSPDLLWVDAGGGASPGQVFCRLRTRGPKQMKLVEREQMPAGPGMFDLSLNVGQRCFVFRSNGDDPPVVSESQSCPAIERLRPAGVSGGTITVRESTAWQILPGRNVLRTFRSDDGGDLETIRFQPAAGMSGTITAAVEFGDGWLVEWRSGPKRWLVLHSAKGEPITTAMTLPVDGDLFDSQNYDGLHFLKWENGKPAELIIVPASVEWSR